MPDYSKGKIYMIKCNLTGEAYYGSTTATLSKRLSRHISNSTCMSNQIIDRGDYDIILIKNYPCETRKELDREEGIYIRNNECVNKIVAGRTIKEWCYENKEHLQEYRKEYKKENREKILEQRKKYYNENKEKTAEQKKKYYNKNKEKIAEQYNKKITCECGCIVSRSCLARHKRTLKHQNFINNNQEML